MGLGIPKKGIINFINIFPINVIRNIFKTRVMIFFNILSFKYYRNANSAIAHHCVLMNIHAPIQKCNMNYYET
jgi:hypothetical protein